MSRRSLELTPELMLRAYRHGLFPMAESRGGDRLYWLDPERRGILPLDGFHVPRRLLRTVLSGRFAVSADTDFPATIAGCAAPAPGREDTWINPQIESLFTTLHRMGLAHSVECRLDGALVGGLYGVALGACWIRSSSPPTWPASAPPRSRAPTTNTGWSRRWMRRRGGRQRRKRPV
jgi:leucyl/phenylalanyl-tRNA--protein transferase